MSSMNSGDQWDPALPNHMKKRPISIKERIQQWKRQRQSIFSDAPHNLDHDASSHPRKIELKVVQILCDKSLPLPLDSALVCSQVGSSSSSSASNDAAIHDILIKYSSQKLIELNFPSSTAAASADGSKTLISSIDYDSLEVLKGKFDTLIKSEEDSLLPDISEHGNEAKLEQNNHSDASPSEDVSEQRNDSIECILSLQSTKERENKKISAEILHLLSKPTAKELSLVEQFRSATGHVQEFCQHGTREECKRVRQSEEPCSKLHFLKIIQKHTDESLGDCSFLNTCFHMDSCKYVHYKVETRDSIKSEKPESSANLSKTCDSATNSIPLMKTLASATEQPFKRVLFPSQWVRCDLRFFDMSILGKFAVVMADPPWDIHMELPYGTMSDDEMRNLNIPTLQDEGIIFLWVTGRAMELGRECLKLWGYERCDELIWVKTNQLQRIIRTGRTGHWINHGKEHCLVGVKGNPKSINRGLDCDVIVAEVRATSHKPDEIYGIIERLSPGTRKIELFGRQHNTQPNWITLGNQLNGVQLDDPQVIEAFKRRYPQEILGDAQLS